MKLNKAPKILIVPDSFKGTLDAKAVAEAIAVGFLRVFPEAKIDRCPMADGGEGSSTVIGELLGADRIECSAYGPDGQTVHAFFYLNKKNNCAYVELAAASGYALMKDKPKAAAQATTFGTGQLIKEAIQKGGKQIVIFLGGSATTG